MPRDTIVRDSGGIKIVENRAPLWTATPAWQVADRPSVVIGRADGPEPYQLFRVQAVRRFPDGRIVVANAGSSELRFYSPRGQHLASVGREGDGPGEFRFLTDVWVHADSVVAFDATLGRLSVFSDRATFGRTLRLPQLEGRNPYLTGILADGSLVLRLGPGGRPLAGQSEAHAVFFRFDDSRGSLDTICEAPDVPRVTVAMAGARATMTFPLPLAGELQSVVSANQLCWGMPDHYEIRCYAADGRLRRIIRSTAVASRPVTKADIENAWDSSTGLPFLMLPALRRMRDEIPFSRTLPLFSDLLLDALGNLWVANSPGPREQAPKWTVFDSGGAVLGTVTLPRGMRLVDADARTVLGIRTDEWGVERVFVYQLLKPD